MTAGECQGVVLQLTETASLVAATPQDRYVPSVQSEVTSVLVGSLVGGLLAFGAAVVLLVYWYRRRRSSKLSHQHDPQDDEQVRSARMQTSTSC